MITENTEIEALSEYYCMPTIEIDMLEIDKSLFDQFTYDFMKKHKIIPVCYDKKGVLIVATAKPLSCHTRSALAVCINAKIDYILVTAEQIDRYVDSISTVVSTTSALEDLNSEQDAQMAALEMGSVRHTPMTTETIIPVIRGAWIAAQLMSLLMYPTSVPM